MRRFLFIAIAALAVGGVLVARNAMQGPPPAKAAPKGEEEKKLIDLKSDLSGPVAPGDSVIFLVGNFAAQHNGAVITCDSAVRYSDKRIEFFGNVLINKNTTYIYGDRAEYNGETNEARVFSDIVKVVDGDATLYTYKFFFNTKSNIGEFDQGGVMINRENLLESVRGFYYADTKELIAVQMVEMRNDEYELKGDSVVYNMATDNAYFFQKTNIWSKDGDYLYGDRGEYQKQDSVYIVTRNGYVLTEKQEMWSDSIDYYRTREHVILRRDIQIDDTEHKVLAFGDYGEYWKDPGNAFLTRRPSLVSYDTEQSDSVFMRADSMYLFTLLNRPQTAAPAADSTATVRPDSLAGKTPASSAEGTPRPAGPESGAADSLGARSVPDSLGGRSLPDSLGGKASMPDSLSGGDAVNPVDTLTPAQRKAKFKEEARKAKEKQKAAEAKIKKQKLAEIAVKRQAKITAKLDAQKERETARLAAMKLKAESKLRARQAKAERKGKPMPVDSTEIKRIDALIALNKAEEDSLARWLIDEWVADSLSWLAAADSVDSLAPRDSIYRLMKGFRNVKIYRSDFQAVCDSITGISTDSTFHLYINPVLWNQGNQITSDVMDIYTKNQQIERAEFVGSPMMVSELDTLHYNQVAGKEMTAFFRDNEIYRHDVDGNAQTLYYNQDGEPPVITMMGVVDCANASFYIEDKQVVQITYRGSPVYTFYPIDKIPPDQDLRLKGFKWEGARRPTQAEVFDRKIRRSERDDRRSLPRPVFPLQQRIDRHRKALVEQRRWADRNDQVDPATVEWMRTLGFEVGQPRPESRK